MRKIAPKSLFWFLTRPRTYPEFFKIFARAVAKFFRRRDTSVLDRYSERCRTSRELVCELSGTFIETGQDVEGLTEQSNSLMLYNLAEYLQAERVIETGVARGNSSLGLLRSLSKRNGRLISSDIPRVHQWVETGSLVPQELQHYWELVRMPDRIALPKAIGKMPEIDLCYYDSDKSYQGRMFAYPLLWDALRLGGIFVSDDIGDNTAFEDFCKKIEREPIIIDSNRRYVGVLIK